MKTYFPVTGQSKRTFKQLDSCHHKISRDSLPSHNILAANDKNQRIHFGTRCKNKREMISSFIKKSNFIKVIFTALFISAKDLTCMYILVCIQWGSSILLKRKMETKSSVFSKRTQEDYIPLLLSLKHHLLSSFCKTNPKFQNN